jgi:YHS domain-containing protein
MMMYHPAKKAFPLAVVIYIVLYGQSLFQRKAGSMNCINRSTVTIAGILMVSAAGFLFAQSGDAGAHKKAARAKSAATVAPEKKAIAPAESSTVAKKTLAPQTTCPVMGGAINKKLYVDYKGKRIYVCCPGCIEELRGNPEKYIKKLEDMGQGVEVIETSAAAQQKKLAPQTTCPVMGEPINRSLYVDYKGKRIYVCCNDCKAKVAEDPEKYIKKLEGLGQSVKTIAEDKVPAVKGKQ